ncbi:glycosyl transferase family 2 [Flavobacterium branchiophilum NBRC 15030 = ATCC 35035]|nr:glycosyl transferase family 2 [Flavobacterium branchiophilum NBRC 15030 = ATCC 35035]
MMDVIFFLFIAVIVIQFSYYVIVFGKFVFAKKTTLSPKKVAVSVLVCAKNEAENVKKFIPLLINQDYPDYEIVLIDDDSNDDTLDIFEGFEKENPKIKLVKVANVEAFWGNKKYALTLGIKAAKNDYLLFTDADCYPKTTHWITEMTAHFEPEKTIVLGYGGYETMEGSFLNKIIRLETVLTATQYFSWAKWGKPYMGVGRNMAYHRSEFFNQNGFINHIKLRSGDDDLFINEAATANNTAICCTEGSFTYSKPKNSFASWIFQKRRHLTTATYYKPFDKLQLGLFYCSQLLFFILSIILLAVSFQWQIVLGLITFRYLSAWLSIGYATKKLKEKEIILWFPILEVALIVAQLHIFLSNLISKPIRWK